MENPFYDKSGNIIDYYTIFNIPYDAASETIKSAFRRLIKHYHPDLSGTISDNLVDKIDLIIRGYRILMDEVSRRDYDRVLFRNRDPKSDSHLMISKKRIKYSVSLADMLKARMHPKQMKRKDILYNFGQDIEIFITPVEAKKGAVANIELQAKMLCPICGGSHSHCHLCNGMGRIPTSSQLKSESRPMWTTVQSLTLISFR
ncbi:MAG TPA: DnaJ domain-containing protein [Spirochaetota bacterium]|nr:DnaJ domain-containing protein [Spirochaetota bacterium]